MKTNMKKSAALNSVKTTMLLATTMACSLASIPAVAADNVTIYGIMDIGVLHQTRNNSAANKGKAMTRIESSGMRQSVLGFKGTENLGNGISAFFNLETHFDVDTGRFHDGGDNGGAGNQMFRRQSNLGFSGDWGSVTVGRQYGPALLAHLGTEPRIFKENFSNLYGWAYGQINTLTAAAPALLGAGTAASAPNNDVGIFFSNSVQYRNTIGPVSFGVLYAPGEVAGASPSRGAVGALGIAYTGPITVSASFQTIKDNTTGVDAVRHSGLGFAVPLDNFTIKGSFLNFRNKNSAGVDTADFKDNSIGVDYKWSPANTLTVAYYNNKDKRNKNDNTKNFIVSNDYSLSKRTTVYGVIANVKAGSAATFGTSVVADASYAAGQTTTFLNTGVNHTF